MEKNQKFTLWYFISLLVGILLLQWLFFPQRYATHELSYTAFKHKVDSGLVERVVIFPDKIVGLYKSPDSVHHAIENSPTAPWRIRLQEVENEVNRQFVVSRIPNVDDRSLLQMLDAHGVDYSGKIEDHTLRNFFLNWILPIVFFVALYGFLFRRMFPRNNFLQVGDGKVKIHDESQQNPVRFSDVAGIDEAVEEVKEVVDFLRNPQKYTRLGGKLPKGVLLVGPPGTGKTLLARAVAGEAGVPFFNISGSDFVEMFVGVGAARVRDLFRQAKEKAPCIIFIDELDAIGKSRSGNSAFVGGYDERENTLNQLLVEMDGFDPTSGLIIFGATNRPQVLDPALLRPGRFDRQIVVDRPDMKGREAIFAVHTRKLKLHPSVDLKQLAAQTPGFAGSEIANVCNEAAIIAVRNGHEAVMQSDFEAAIERVIAGLERKSRIISPKEKQIVAYHEAGHAIVGYFTPGADRVQKVSIVPRGIGALGYTLQMPLEDRYLMTKSELLGKIKGLLGGRAAEEIVFHEVSTGASNDLERVAQLARHMITVYGMSDKLPNLSLVAESGPGFLKNELYTDRRSEKLEQQIDEETYQIIAQCYAETKQLLTEKRELLDRLAQALMEKEVLNREEIDAILSEAPAPIASSQNT